MRYGKEAGLVTVARRSRLLTTGYHGGGEGVVVSVMWLRHIIAVERWFCKTPAFRRVSQRKLRV